MQPGILLPLAWKVTNPSSVAVAVRFEESRKVFGVPALTSSDENAGGIYG
jgi:hypothetical protein